MNQTQATLKILRPKDARRGYAPLATEFIPLIFRTKRRIEKGGKRILLQDETEQKITRHALISGAWATGLLTVVLFYAGRPTWAVGFLIGSLLSLFSMISLSIIVPILFRPSASAGAKGLLSMTLFMKLPIFGAVLYFVAKGTFAEPMAVAAGIALIPAVLTGYAIRQAFLDAQRETEMLSRKAALRAAQRANFPVAPKTTPQTATPAFALHHKQTELPAKADRRATTHSAEPAPQKQATPVHEVA
jgi:hypothetical protein